MSYLPLVPSALQSACLSSAATCDMKRFVDFDLVLEREHWHCWCREHLMDGCRFMAAYDLDFESSVALLLERFICQVGTKWTMIWTCTMLSHAYDQPQGDASTRNSLVRLKTVLQLGVCSH